MTTPTNGTSRVESLERRVERLEEREQMNTDHVNRLPQEVMKFASDSFVAINTLLSKEVKDLFTEIAASERRIMDKIDARASSARVLLITIVLAVIGWLVAIAAAILGFGLHP
jgi:hypothetical protein